MHVARERNRILRELAVQKKAAFMGKFVGQKIEAITLNVISDTPDGTWTEALTDNYLKLQIQGKHEPNRWLNVQNSSVGNNHLVGNNSCVI